MFLTNLKVGAIICFIKNRNGEWYVMCIGYNFSDSETKKVKFLDFGNKKLYLNYFLCYNDTPSVFFCCDEDVHTGHDYFCWNNEKEKSKSKYYVAECKTVDNISKFLDNKCTIGQVFKNNDELNQNIYEVTYVSDKDVEWKKINFKDIEFNGSENTTKSEMKGIDE